MSNSASTMVPIEKHESRTKGGLVVSHLDDSEISRLEERAAVTMADSSTLGLWGSPPEPGSPALVVNSTWHRTVLPIGSEP